jgi:hypothetical protein
MRVQEVEIDRKRDKECGEARTVGESERVRRRKRVTELGWEGRVRGVRSTERREKR